MTYETKLAYSEVCAVLENVPNEYVNKIPKKLIELFNNEKLENYQANINKSNPLDNNYLSEKTMVLIAILNYRFWCPNKKVKSELYKQYLENNENYQKKMNEKYSTDNLFKNKRNLTQVEQVQETVVMVKYKEPLFKKITKIIKSIILKITNYFSI